MPYVDRDGSNIIKALYAVAQRAGQEFVADNDAGVLAYLNPPPPTPDQLEAQGATKFAVDPALMAIAKVMAKEVNALRAQAGLTPFTIPQWLAKFAAAYGGKAIP